MSTTATLGALLEDRAQALVGRDREREALLDLVRADRPIAAVVHGVAGVGKTALLEAVRADARAAGARVVTLDGRGIEPTRDGFVAALGAAVGCAPTDAAVAAALAGDGDRVLLVLDACEALGILDTWLAHAFVPALPVNARVLMAGRAAPSGAWTAHYGDALLEVPLGGLAPAAAERLLRDAGVDPGVNLLAHGHPLTLRLACSALLGRPRPAGDDGTDLGPLVDRLARQYLEGLDAPTWRALGAASVTRRTTLSVLGALLPGEPAWEAFERLRTLPFVDLVPDGLVVHDMVRAAAAAVLRAADPVTYARHRAVAWRTLHAELRHATGPDLWRYTADLLYLVDRPIVRQYFFPETVLDCAVEPARPDDWPAIAALAAEERVLDMSRLETWWRAVPEAFAVARRTDGEVVGFRCLADRTQLPRDTGVDPVAAAVREHLRRDPVPRDAAVLVLPFIATREDRDAPSHAQAALLLDLKRAYVAARPALRRSYVTAPVLAADDGRCVQVLGYVPVPGQSPAAPYAHRLVFNDFGPGSIDGWLTDLAARELGIEPESPVDVVQRRLRLDGEPVDLTQLEFDVLRYLQQREGRAVTRDELLRDVWGHEWTGGSNVVEVAVSGLRRKLGARASALRTVRGVGYRLDALA